MADLIDRQAAIDAHCELCPDKGKCNCDICPDVEVFQLLPFAQPEQVFFVKTNRFLSPTELKKLEESLKSQHDNIILLPEDCSLVYPERKKGKWVKTIKHYKGDDTEFDFYAIKCSACGEKPEKAYHLTRYCPNCGSYNGG